MRAEPCESCGHPVELREQGKWWERFNAHHWIEHDPERCRAAKAGLKPWPLTMDGQDLLWDPWATSTEETT